LISRPYRFHVRLIEQRFYFRACKDTPLSRMHSQSSDESGGVPGMIPCLVLL